MAEGLRSYEINFEVPQLIESFSTPQVPYKQLGVFFNITDTSNWMKWEETMKPMKMEWQYHPTIRASHETEARWWIPDTPIDDVTIHVPLPFFPSSSPLRLP